MNENIENNTEQDEEIDNFITLTDDNGEDISFEILDVIEYKERSFAVLLPFEDTEDEVVILEIISDEENEADEFISVDDDELIEEVFEIFQNNYENDSDE